ncbi:MAG: STAS domain-containing protein [Leptospira sp.]|nr:STAS domain-containing protein [Leptospira sp.]
MSIDLDSPDFNHDGSELKIQIRREEIPEFFPVDGVIIDITGDINLYSAQAIKNIINNLIDAGKLKIFINLEEVMYIDSSGLGAFLSAQSKLLKISGFLKIFSPSKSVGYVLDLTKLRSLLKVHDTLAIAIESL